MSDLKCLTVCFGAQANISGNITSASEFRSCIIGTVKIVSAYDTETLDCECAYVCENTVIVHGVGKVGCIHEVLNQSALDTRVCTVFINHLGSYVRVIALIKLLSFLLRRIEAHIVFQDLKGLCTSDNVFTLTFLPG